MIVSGEENINRLSKLLLEVGALLMASGANTARIRITVLRIAEAYGYNAELLITHRALMLTLYDEEKDYFFSRLKRTSPHGVNFRMVSGISRMSWRIVDEKWNFDQVQQEIDRLKSLPHYPRLVILTTVALAGASFCRLFFVGFLVVDRLRCWLLLWQPLPACLYVKRLLKSRSIRICASSSPLLFLLLFLAYRLNCSLVRIPTMLLLLRSFTLYPGYR